MILSSPVQIRPEFEIPGVDPIFVGAEDGARAECFKFPALKLRNILVPFDFSDASFLLLRHLTPIAEKAGAALHLLHVTSPEQAGEEAGDHEGCPAVLRDNAEPLLRFWANDIVRDRVSCSTWVQVGSPVDSIVVMAKTLCVDLIVMVTHGYGGLKHAYLRSTAERVTRHAPCPVLTIPQSELTRFGNGRDAFPHSCKRILMPVEFSAAARAGLKYAAAIALENEAALRLLNVVAVNRHELASQRDFRWEAEERLGAWVRSVLPVHVEFESSIWSGESSLYAVLLEAKRFDAELIVLPTRRYDWAKRLRIGCVTDGILRHAPCPVLSIHEDLDRDIGG